MRNTDDNKDRPISRSNMTPFPVPEQIREEARQKARSIKPPDLESMTHEEIQQLFYEMQVRKLEAELQNEQFRSEGGNHKDQAELLTTVIENMVDMVVLSDLEGNIKFAGNAYEIVGYEKGFLIGKNVMDFVHPEHLSYVREEFSKLLSSGGPLRVEYRFRCNDGSYIWLETIGKILKGENDSQGEIVFSSRNITDRKQMEKALKKSERLASLMFDSLSAHMAILNEKGTIISVNKAWRQFAQSNSAEMSKICEGVNYLDICDNARGHDAGDAAEFATGIRAVLAGEKDEFIAEYPCHSAAEQRWFLGRVTRFPVNGETRLVVAHENVTLRKQAEDELENFFYVNLDLLCIADVHGNFLKVNREWENMLGYTADELQNTKFLDFVHPEDIDATLAAMSQLARQEKVINFVNRYKNKEGFYHFIEWRSSPKGDLIYAAARDITDKKRTEEALRKSENRLRGIMESTLDAIIMMDHGGAISFWNPAAGEILGYRAEEVIGQDLHELLAPERYHKAYRAAFQEFLKTGRGNAVGKTVELSALHKNGHEIMVALTLSAVLIQERWHAVGVLRDITERKKVEEELTLLANTDNLTGLFNRRVLIKKLSQEMARCRRYGTHAVVMMLDLDYFKSINDTHGHAVGDMVLAEFARLLAEITREADVVGRVGGEEFAVLLPETTMDEAASLAERILRYVRKSFVATDSGNISFTTSIGFDQLHATDTHTDQILARADNALYRAKTNGRDRAEAGCGDSRILQH